MIDRFGKYPRSVSNLLEYAKLRLKAQDLRILSMERKASEIVLKFREDTPLATERVLSLAHQRDDLFFSPDGALVLALTGSEPAEVFGHLNGLLDKISIDNET
jgi:transcription-repair coupling factor (superfamily II helicase)